MNNYFSQKNEATAMTMDEFQKYREIKDLVESSYPDKTECKNIWASVRHLLLYYSEYEFRKNQLEVFSQILETGKPLCHLDFYRGYEDDDPIFDLLDKPFVCFPFTQCLWECDTEKNLYRFFFVNPDVHGARDFTFKSKLALRDTDIVLTSSDNNAARMQDSVCFKNLQLPETSKFIVCCEANSKSIQFGGVFEVQHAAEGKAANTVTAIKIANDEFDMQKKFCQKMKTAFKDLKKLQELAKNNSVWRWPEFIKKSFL